MKKRYYLLIGFYAFLVLAIVIHSTVTIFEGDWQLLLNHLERLEKLLFLVFVLTMSLTILMSLALHLVQTNTVKKVDQQLTRLLNGQVPERLGQEELDFSFQKVSEKVLSLTEHLQKTENQILQSEEEIVEEERKRIARDLHDTVSQELFAANMILSGVTEQVEHLDSKALVQQLTGVSAILNTAQKDLRVLLLHLRPIELEGRSLVEGMQVILKELSDKSDIKVNFHHQLAQIPTQIEEHIFRIAQEIISNTLRHANASCLDVYLYQSQHELQLKMVDDGVGFDRNETDELSYGLRNMRERVNDMAGQMQILTAPKQGVAVDIRVPLIEGV